MFEQISGSRTYMIGVYDPVCPNEIRFEKVVLPETSPNSIKEAKTYFLYLLDDIEDAKATRIVVCISIEEYLNATHSQFAQSDKEDVELTLNMLYSWNSKQETPFVSYSEALGALFKHVALMEDFRKIALEILQTLQ